MTIENRTDKTDKTERLMSWATKQLPMMARTLVGECSSWKLSLNAEVKATFMRVILHQLMDFWLSRNGADLSEVRAIQQRTACAPSDPRMAWIGSEFETLLLCEAFDHLIDPSAGVRTAAEIETRWQWRCDRFVELSAQLYFFKVALRSGVWKWPPGRKIGPAAIPPNLREALRLLAQPRHALVILDLKLVSDATKALDQADCATFAIRSFEAIDKVCCDLKALAVARTEFVAVSSEVAKTVVKILDQVGAGAVEVRVIYPDQELTRA